MSWLASFPGTRKGEGPCIHCLDIHVTIRIQVKGATGNCHVHTCPCAWGDNPPSMMNITEITMWLNG